MNPHELQAVVKSVNARSVVLSANGVTFEWPRDRAPQLKTGDSVVVRLLTESQASADRHEQARTVLKELLGGER